MAKKPVKYEINEQDIESTLRYLKANVDSNATREDAIAKLEELQAGVNLIGHKGQKELEKLLEELEAGKKPTN
ncbi:MAG: hypothetical protein AAB414_05375 [Patescibacteria group bacterium]